MELNLQLRPLADPSRYRHIVSSLVYLTITRPNIAHVIHILSQFVGAPTSVHYAYLLRLLRYLRGTATQRLFYAKSSPLQLHAYSDSTQPGHIFTENRTPNQTKSNQNRTKNDFWNFGSSLVSVFVQFDVQLRIRYLCQTKPKPRGTEALLQSQTPVLNDVHSPLSHSAIGMTLHFFKAGATAHNHL
jgi:hypothetical protein